MSLFKLMFAGQIKKVDMRAAGKDQIAELSICKKEKGRGDGAEDTYTWVRVTVWNPKDFQAAKMIKDNFAAGCGDFKLRSYEHNDEKKVSAEVRCSSYDIEISDGGAPSVSAPAPAPRPAQRPAAPAAPPADDGDSCPF